MTLPLKELSENATQWRRKLHENPQTAYEEEFAASLVKEKLEEWGISYKSGIAGTGIVATIKGNKSSSGKTVGLRGDMDALDIVEKTNVAHSSKIPGKMHACGHDGHTAILLATAKYLHDNPDFDGTAHLIFQPAEEGAKGANKMMEERLFTDFPCDMVFGLHNWPYLEKGQIATRVGPIMAAVDSVEITVTGQGAHAAMPQYGRDPLIAAASLVMQLQTIVSRNVSPIDTAVISVTNLNCGTGADNIISDTATLSASVRSFKPEVRALLEQRIREICKATGLAHQVSIDIEYHQGTEPTINAAEGVEIASRAATQTVGIENVILDVEPCMGGEDFGAMLQDRPGAYVWIGQREPEEDSRHNQSLHSPFYDFNDEIIPTGVTYFANVVKDYLKEDDQTA